MARHALLGAPEGQRLEVPVRTGQTAGRRGAGRARRGAGQAAVARQVPAPPAGGADAPVTACAAGRGARGARAPGESVALRAGAAREGLCGGVCRAHSAVCDPHEAIATCCVVARATVRRSGDSRLRWVVATAARGARGIRCAAEAARRAGSALTIVRPEPVCRAGAGARKHSVQGKLLAPGLAL